MDLEREVESLRLKSWDMHARGTLCPREDNLIEVFKKTSEQPEVYAFKQRIKPAEKILQKVVRKRADGKSAVQTLCPGGKRQTKLDFRGDLEKYRAYLDELQDAKDDQNYVPHHMTDIWGARFIVLFQNEIPALLARLLSNLKQFNTTVDVQRAVTLKEATIYTSRTDVDPLSIVQAVQNVLTNSDFMAVDGKYAKIFPPKSKKSAYSSVHLIFERRVAVPAAIGDAKIGTIAFEVQFRDIFEEAWGEIEHRLIYSGKDQLDLKMKRSPQHWVLNLNALKTIVDGCSQQASIIGNERSSKREITSLPLSASITSRLSDLSLIVDALEQVGCPNKILSLLHEAYQSISIVDSREEFNAIESAAKSAAKRLGQCLKDTKKWHQVHVVKSVGTTVQFYLRMELAIANFTAVQARKKADPGTNGGTTEEDAQKILDGCESEFRWASSAVEKSVSPDFRLAQLLIFRAQKEDQLLEALKLCTRVYENAAQDTLTGKSHWIRVGARFYEGYAYWKLAKFRDAESRSLESLGALNQAFVTSKQCYELSKSLEQDASSDVTQILGMKSLSNALYFGAETLTNPHLVGEERVIAKEAVEGLVAISEIEDSKNYPFAFKSRDNLAHAYAAIGDPATALQLAKSNFSELRSIAERRAERHLDAADVGKYLGADENVNFVSCQKMIKRFSV